MKQDAIMSTASSEPSSQEIWGLLHAIEGFGILPVTRASKSTCTRLSYKLEP